MDLTVKKLKALHQSIVFHDQFVDKYDAISLASMDVDKPIPQQTAKIEFKSLQRLSKEVLDILNEGSIVQQSIVISVQRNLELCGRSLLTIKARGLEEADLLSLDSDSSQHTANGESLGDNQKRGPTNSQSLEDNLLASDLHMHMRQSFQCISECMESRVLTLRLLHELFEHYHHSIVDLATANGVLNADQRAQFIIPPRVQPLLQHKIFNSNEEEELLQKVRKLWAEAVLGNGEYTGLADADLNQIIQRQKTTTLPALFFAKLGAVAILLCWSISECYNNEYMGQWIWQDPTFAIFMCFGDLLLLLLMWGVSMHVWKSAGIDYIRLLDLQHTEIAVSNAPVPMVLQSFANASLLFLITFIAFNKAMRNSWKGYMNIAYVHAIPVLLALFFLWRMVFPFESRKNWLYMLWKVLAAPFYSVDFCAGYVGDLLTSLVRVSIPFVFSLIYVGISIVAWLTNRMDWAVSSSDTWWSKNKFFTLILTPVLTLIPLWIRLVQCLRRSVETGQRWPHMGNALKYTSAMAVIAHGTFQPSLRQHPVWILCFVGATLFQFGWDIFQDWGIVEVSWITSSVGYREDIGLKKAGKTNLEKSWLFLLTDMRVRLRSKRMLGPAWTYIALMVFNLALRFAWTLTLLPADPNSENDFSLYATMMRHIGPFVAAAEIVRRMVWGFYRLEWEQITLIQKAASVDEKDIENLLFEQKKTSLLQSNLDIESPRLTNMPLVEIADDQRQKENQEDTSDSDDEDNALIPLNIEMTDLSINQSNSDPFDWTQCLPRDLFETLYHSSTCSCVTSWEAKLRLIESVVFASVVLLLLVVAAYPALNHY